MPNFEDMPEFRNQRYAKHTSFFQIENTKELAKLYEDLGIIGEISYDEDMSDEDVPFHECSPSTPKLKRPVKDSIVRCQTPKKPRRPRRLNGENMAETRSSQDGGGGLFKFCTKRRSYNDYQPSLSSKLSL